VSNTEYLSGVENMVGIQGGFDLPHYLQVGLAHHQFQIIFAFVADTVAWFVMELVSITVKNHPCQVKGIEFYN